MSARRNGQSYQAAPHQLEGRFVKLTRRVIGLAEAWREEELRGPLSINLRSVSIEQILNPTPEPAERALREFLEGLAAADAIKLQTVMYYGRDGGETDIHKLHRHLRIHTRDSSDAIETMLEKVPLGEYLTAGLRGSRARHRSRA